MPATIHVRALCLLTLAMLLLTSPTSSRAEDQPALKKASPSTSEWKIVIIPANNDTPIRAAVSGDSVGLASVASDEPPVSAASGTKYPRMSYEEAYNSIPFSRAEYEANPSYRHDAAMELMLGAPRPTTIVRQTVPYFSRYPDFIRNRFNVFPYAPSNPGAIDVNLNYRTSVMAY